MGEINLDTMELVWIDSKKGKLWGGGMKAY
jgi:hypothetical protein